MHEEVLVNGKIEKHLGFIYSINRKQYFKQYRIKNKIVLYEKKRLWIQKFRNRVLEAYGNKCVCCGENYKEFLAIDHIEGGGNKKKREIGKNGACYYKWIINNNFPKDLQILCHNCNMAKGLYGKCPHEDKKCT